MRLRTQDKMINNSLLREEDKIISEESSFCK